MLMKTIDNNVDNKRSSIDEQIWKRIKFVASIRGMSMMNLSAKLGKSQNYMNQMMADAKKIPCAFLFEIAKVLDVPAEYLFSGNTDPFSSTDTMRKMIAFISLNEDLLSKGELKVLYTTMLNMLENHYDSEDAFKKISRAEEQCLLGTVVTMEKKDISEK